MKLSEILSDSFRYPVSNPKRSLTLGILLFFSTLIIPSILSSGYMLRIIKHSFEGSDELPPFNEWFNMFVDGLKVIVVNIIYTAIPAIIVMIIVISIVVGMFVNQQTLDYSAFMTTFLSMFLVVGVIVMAVPYLFRLIALPHMVKNDKLDVLLQLRTILNIIHGIGWGKFLAAVAVLVVINIPLSALGFYLQFLQMGTVEVLLISSVLSFAIGWYLLAFEGRLLALLYQEGSEEL